MKKLVDEDHPLQIKMKNIYLEDEEHLMMMKNINHNKMIICDEL